MICLYYGDSAESYASLISMYGAGTSFVIQYDIELEIHKLVAISQDDEIVIAASASFEPVMELLHKTVDALRSEGIKVLVVSEDEKY